MKAVSEVTPRACVAGHFPAPGFAVVALVDGHEGEEALHPPGDVRFAVLENGTGRRIAELRPEKYEPERRADTLAVADFDGDGVEEIVHRIERNEVLLTSRALEVCRLDGGEISVALRLYEAMVDQYIPHLGTLRCAATVRIEPAGGASTTWLSKGRSRIGTSHTHTGAAASRDERISR